MIIGLSGYGRAGKNTAANGLEGYHQRAFADVLREFLFKMDPVLVATDSAPGVKADPKSVQEVIKMYGWEGVKKSPYAKHMRDYLQRLGSDCGRELIGQNVWVDATMNNLPSGDVVLTDVRFPNEADAIRTVGGYIVRIERPGQGPVNDHYSETALDNYDYDFVVVNDQDVVTLHQEMVDIVEILTNR